MAPGSSFAPSAIQSRIISNDLDPRVSRKPPSCGTCPSGLVSIRLVSAPMMSIRRPLTSRVTVMKSWSGR